MSLTQESIRHERYRGECFHLLSLFDSLNDMLSRIVFLVIGLPFGLCADA